MPQIKTIKSASDLNQDLQICDSPPRGASPEPPLVPARNPLLVLPGMPSDAPDMQLDFLKVLCETAASDQSHDQKRVFIEVGDLFVRPYGAIEYRGGGPLWETLQCCTAGARDPLST